MAELVLIDRYLDELRTELRWVRRSEQIVEEVTDHLLESLEQRLGRGVEPIEAEKQALEEFGDPRLVGKTFASSLAGGIAVPTQFTRKAGYAFIVSSVLWLAGMVLLYWSDRVDRTEPWEGTPQVLWMLGSYTLVVACVLVTVGIAGIIRRHGRATGVGGRVAFWGSMVLAFFTQAAWAPALWTTLLLVVAGSIYASGRAHNIAPQGTLSVVAVGAVVTFAGGWWTMLAEAEWFGSAAGYTMLAGVTLTAAGLALTGRWMAGEQAISEDEPLAVA